MFSNNSIIIPGHIISSETWWSKKNPEVWKSVSVYVFVNPDDRMSNKLFHLCSKKLMRNSFMPIPYSLLIFNCTDNCQIQSKMTSILSLTLSTKILKTTLKTRNM